MGTVVFTASSLQICGMETRKGSLSNSIAKAVITAIPDGAAAKKLVEKSQEYTLLIMKATRVE